MDIHTGGSNGAAAEINMTPLIDVLSVTFMVMIPSTPVGLGQR